MIKTLEILGVLIVLVLAWIGIAEVFPQYGFDEGFGEDEEQEDGIDNRAGDPADYEGLQSLPYVQLRYEGLEDGSIEIWDSNVQYCKIPAWAVKGFVVEHGLGKPEMQEYGHWKIF